MGMTVQHPSATGAVYVLLVKTAHGTSARGVFASITDLEGFLETDLGYPVVSCRSYLVPFHGDTARMQKLDPVPEGSVT